MSENKVENKNGRWSKEDEKFMAENYKLLTIQDIATQLKRNPITVEKYIRERFNGGKDIIVEVKQKDSYDITNSPVWVIIKTQFSQEEQEYFLFLYSQVMHQFKYDVLPTERMQVIEVCRLDILIARALTKMNEIKHRVEEMSKQIDLEKSVGDLEKEDMMRIQQLDMNRISSETAHVNYSKDYKELLDRRNNLFKEIKGTREQRIKRIEESKETIGTMLAALIDNHQMRRDLGIQLEKFRLGVKIEYERLSEYHTYLDGKVEQPFLNSDNIKEDNN